MPYTEFRDRARNLRRQGKTYREIKTELGVQIPKSTLSQWCSSIELTIAQRAYLKKKMIEGSEVARHKAHAVIREKRIRYLADVDQRVAHLPAFLKENNDAGKIAIAMLYLGEGSKNTSGRLSFGNSDPGLLALFLGLLRRCYVIDENKFRCTMQCRADQDMKGLEIFWSNVTGIPLSQFYKGRFDARTVGKPSVKLDYKGVCRVDYMSADLYWEVMAAGRFLMGL